MKLQIKVIPSSSKDCIAGWLEDTLKVKVKAPPEKGKANKAVIKVLEKLLELPKGSIVISSGTSSTKKIIEINGVDEISINKKLAVVCTVLNHLCALKNIEALTTEAQSFYITLIASFYITVIASFILLSLRAERGNPVKR